MRSCLSYAFLIGIVAATQTQADSRLSIGTEGFHDHYQEENATVNISSWYGSATGSYEYTNNGFLFAVDGRYSQGREDYNSISGKLNGEHAVETDNRLRIGLDVQVWHGRLMPYIGGGWRYYFDEGKGLETNSVPPHVAYDRHISQFYVPLGATYRFTSGGWTFAPTVEANGLVYGQVNSHFAAIGVGPNITNQQHTGWGLRGEFMAGQQYRSFGWEAGPFVRYWHINGSNCKDATEGGLSACWGEPPNARLQAGAALRLTFQ